MATIGPFKLHATTPSAAISGTITTATEADIVTGGKTLIITLTRATWLAAGAAFDAIRQDIINGLDSAQAEATGWDALVVPALAVTDVARTSDTVVTITLPAVATYDITAEETITVTVPASATSAASAIVAAPTVSIAVAGGFLMLLTPSTLVANTSLTVDVDYEVDWGDGIFVAYSAGVTAAQTPTSTITVRAGAATSFTLLSNTVAAIDIQSGATIASLQDFGFTSIIGGPFSNLTSFNFDGTNAVTTLASADFFFGRFPSSLVSFAMDCSNVTSLVRTFRFCSSLTTVNIVTTSGLTDITAAFSGCSALTSFPLIDTSGVTTAAAAWDSCTGLTAFPALNLGSAVNISSAWNQCTGLTSFPALGLGNVLNASRAWRNCSGLTAFPTINLPSATNIGQAWQGCSGLTAFPSITVSAATAINSAWFGCSGLTAFPALTLTAATNADSAWQNCTGLTGFPVLSMPAVTSLVSAWQGCTGLTSFPALTLATVIDMGSAFEGCTALETFPDTSYPGGEDFDRMFFGCASLVQVGQLGTPVGLNFTRMFSNNPSLRCVNAIDTTTVGSVKVEMFGAQAIKHPDPDEIDQIISASGLAYVNASTGDCAPWVCVNQYTSQYLAIDPSGEFGDKSMLIESVDFTGHADPLANITLAHTDTVLDFSSGMTLLAGGVRYTKTVGNLEYNIAIGSGNIASYWVRADASTLASELGIFEVDQFACVVFV